ncbi:VRR-NUC domain-containing protein [Acidovorax sp.]|uniref:VRR-NUC domain-containing protein n=1 Tax=Acidovorax sp. TaxID=1872122 RepID=UPI0025C0402C|nr:VRR-NUC domain-containing protein [Acidovorax sp.]
MPGPELDVDHLFMTVREREVEAELVRRVQAAGGQAYKFTSPGRRGVPDRLVLLPGRAPEFVELKRKGQKAKPHQVREHERMRAAGAVVHIIDDEAGIDRLLENRHG